MKTKEAKKTIPITVTLEVDADTYTGLVEFLTNVDMFRGDHCGYWAQGVQHDKHLGWLVWEHGGTGGPASGEEFKALRAWRSSSELPKGWFKLNDKTAKEAIARGIARYGVVGFFEGGDASRYDVAIQLALLGEVRYG